MAINIYLNCLELAQAGMRYEGGHCGERIPTFARFVQKKVGGQVGGEMGGCSGGREVPSLSPSTDWTVLH